MSNVIEDRVLKMELDNSNFESNAKQSLSTLDKLKEKLKMRDSSQGMDDLGKAVKQTNLKPLAESAEAVKVKFSALQIAGVAALTKIANSAMDAGEKLVKGLTIDQVNAGWDKYAEKTSAVQTIMAATAKDFTNQEVQMAAVNAQLDKMMWYTDETSYNFNDMVSNVGKFTSNNVKLDDAVNAMMGISSWAAVSGANVNQASHAMYNLSQSIAMGSVRLSDWMSIENANMATAEFKETAIETALAMGTLKKDTDGTVKSLNNHEVSITKFRDTLQDEWFTTEVLMETLKTYGGFSDELYKATQQTGLSATELLDYISQYKDGTLDMAAAVEETGVSAEALDSVLKHLSDSTMALGEKSLRAGQETKTFGEAIAAVKDAVSSGWSQTFELIFGDYTQAKELWSAFAEDLYEIFVESGNQRNELLSRTMDAYGEFEKQLTACGVTAGQFEDALVDAAKGAGVPVDELIKKYGSLTEALKNGALSKNIITDALDLLVERAGKFSEGIKTVSDATKEAEANLEKFQNVVNAVIRGEFSVGAERMKMLADAGYDYATVQGLVNKVWERSGKTWKDTTITIEDLALAIGDMSAEQQEALGITAEQAATLADLAKQAKETGTPMEELINLMMKPSGRLLFVDSLHNIMQGLLKTLNVVKEAWAETMGTFTATGLYSVIEAFDNFTKKLNYSDGTAEKLKSTLKGVLSLIDLLVIGLKGIAGSGITLLRLALGHLDINLLDFTAKIGDGITALHDWVIGLKEMPEWLSRLGSKLDEAGQKIKNWVMNNKLVPDSIKKIVTTLTSGIGKLKDWVLSIGHAQLAADGVRSKIMSLKDALHSLGQTIANTKVYQTVAEVFRTVWPAAMTVGERAIAVLGRKAEAVWDTLKKVFSGRFDEIDLGTFEGGLKKVKDGLLEFGKDVQEFFKGLGEKIVEFVKQIRELDGFSLENVSAAFGAFRDTVVRYIADVGSHWGGLKSSITGIGGGIVSTIQNVIGEFNSFVKAIFGVDNAIEGAVKLVSGGAMAEAAGALHEYSGAVQETAESSQDLQKAGEMLKKFAVAFKTHTQSVVDSGALATTAVFSVFIAGIWKAGKMIDKAGSTFGTQIDRFTGPLTAFTDLIKSVKGPFDALKTYITTATKQLKYAHILEIAGAIAILAGSLFLLSKIPSEDLLKAGGALLGIMGVLILMEAASSVFMKNAKGLAQAVGPLIAIAGAMLMLAAAVKMLESAEWSSLAKAGAVLVGFLGAVVGFSMAMKKWGAQITASMGTIMLMSAAFLALAAAVKILSTIEIDDDFIGVISGVAAVFAELLIVMGILTALSKGNKFGAIISSGGLIGMVVALGLLVGVIKEIDKMQIDDLIGTVIKLGAMLLALTGIMAILNRFGGGSMKAGIGAMALAGALALLMVPIKLLSMMDESTFETGRNRLIQLELMVGAMAVVMGLASAGPLGKNAIKAGTSLLLISVALGILVGVIAALALIDEAGLKRGVAAIDTLMVGFSIILLSLSAMKDSMKDAKGVLIQMAIIIGLLGVALGVLAMMDPASLAGATIAMVSVMLACALLFAAVGKLKAPAKEALGSILLIAAVIASLTAALWLLAGVGDPSGLIVSAAALSALMFVLAGVLKSMAKIHSVAQSAINGAVALGAVFVMLAVAMALMGNIDPLSAVADAAALAILMITLKEVLTSMEGLEGPAGKALGGIAILAAIAAGLGLALAAMSNIGDAKAIMEIAGSISAVMLVFTQMNDTIALLGAMDFKDSMKALGVMAIFITGLTTLIGGLGAFAKYLQGNGVDVEGAFEQVGRLVGKIVGGIGAAASEALPEIGDNLAAFGDKVAPFFESIKGIDSGSIESVKTLAETLGMLTLNDFVGKIENGLFGSSIDFEKLGGDLEKLGSGVRKFIDSVNGDDQVDPEKLQSALDVLTTLTDFQNSLSSTGGMLQEWTGVKDLGTFAESLSTFATKLKDFSTEIQDIDLETGEGSKFQMVMDAAQAMIDLQNTLKPLRESGSIGASIFGSNDLGSFGTSLYQFATSMKTFGKALTGEDSALTNDEIAAMKKLPEIVQPLIDLQASLGGETVGGIVAGLSGHDENLGDFGSTLATLGEGLGSLYTSLKEAFPENRMGKVQFPTELFQQMAAAITSLVGINKMLQAEGNGDMDLTALLDFSYTLPNTLSEFKMAFDRMKEIELDDDIVAKAGKIMLVIQKFVGIQQQLNSSAASLAASGGEGVSLDGFGGQISSLVAAIQRFATTLGGDGGIDMAQLEAAGDILKNAIIKIKDAFTEFTDVDFSGMETFATTMNTVVSGSISTAVTTFNEKAAEMQEAVSLFFSDVNTAIDLGSTDLTTKFETMFNGLSSAAEGAKSSFLQAGTDICNSFKEGLSAGVDGMGESFTTALENVLTQAKAYADNFQQVGKAITTGVADGLHNSMTIIAALNAVLQAAAASCASTATGYFVSVGRNISLGVAKGIHEGMGAVRAAAAELISIAQKAAAAAGEIKSPSRLFARTIGRWIPEGVAKGMDQHAGCIQDSAVRMAMTTLAATQKALKIHSPSLIFKDEVGRYIAEGIAEGIEDCKTPEEQAKKKAENILQAFKDAIDKLNLKGEIRKLEEELFEVNTPGVSYSEIFKAQQEERDAEIKDLEKEIKFRKDSLENLKEQGISEDSDEYENALKELLTAEIKLANLHKEDIDAQYDVAKQIMDANQSIDEKMYALYESLGISNDTYTASEREIHNLETKIKYSSQTVSDLVTKLNAYAAAGFQNTLEFKDLQGQVLDALKEWSGDVNALNQKAAEIQDQNREAYKMTLEEINAENEDGERWMETFIKLMENQGKTRQEAIDMAWESMAKRNGYQERKLVNAAETVSGATTEATAAVQEMLATGDFSKLGEVFGNLGTQFGTSLTTGFRTAKTEVTESTQELVTNVNAVVAGNDSVWAQAGKSWVQKLADAIEENAPILTDAVQDVAHQAGLMMVAGGVPRLMNAIQERKGASTSSDKRNMVSVVIPTVGTAPDLVNDIFNNKTNRANVLVVPTNSTKTDTDREGGKGAASNTTIINNTVNSPKALNTSEVFRLIGTKFAQKVNHTGTTAYDRVAAKKQAR